MILLYFLAPPRKCDTFSPTPAHVISSCHPARQAALRCRRPPCMRLTLRQHYIANGAAIVWWLLSATRSAMRTAQAARAPSADVRLPALPGQQLFTRHAAPQQHRAAGKARWRRANGGGATGGAYRQRQRETVTAAASRDQLALLEQPVRPVAQLAPCKPAEAACLVPPLPPD